MICNDEIEIVKIKWDDRWKIYRCESMKCNDDIEIIKIQWDDAYNNNNDDCIYKAIQKATFNRKPLILSADITVPAMPHRPF